MEQIEDEEIIEDSFEEDAACGLDMMTMMGAEEKRKKTSPVVARPQLGSVSVVNQSTARRIDRLCEFAECLMHCLLFKINYYDKKAHFDKCLKYDVVVYVIFVPMSKLTSYLFVHHHVECYLLLDPFDIAILFSFSIFLLGFIVSYSLYKGLFCFSPLSLFLSFSLSKRCQSEIVCEYIANCIECLRLVLYDKCNIDGAGRSSDQQPHASTSLAIGLAVLKEPSTHGVTHDDQLLIKRYTLEIDTSDTTKPEGDIDREEQEWSFRDAIIKCLYSKETQYPSNFRWQIQLRTSVTSMKEMNKREDLFKLFAWRECNQEETSSSGREATQISDSKKTPTYNTTQTTSSIRPIKTIDLGFSKCQLFLEQPVVTSSLPATSATTNTRVLSQRLKKRVLRSSLSNRPQAANDSDSNE